MFDINILLRGSDLKHALYVHVLMNDTVNTYYVKKIVPYHKNCIC
jgi:hypothetical protein